jgi:hypothetical protein
MDDDELIAAMDNDELIAAVAGGDDARLRISTRDA